MKKLTRLVNLEKKYRTQVEELEHEYQQKHLDLQQNTAAKISDLTEKLSNKESIIESEVKTRIKNLKSVSPKHPQLDVSAARQALLSELN